MKRAGVVLITGAGSGIGRALAVGFASEGYDVVGFGRNRQSLLETEQACGGGFVSFAVDVGDAADTVKAVDAVRRDIGDIDVLICSAAVYPRCFFLDQTAEEWSSVLTTNIIGVANCCRTVLPQMFERRFGRIVVVGSLADFNPIRGASAYSVSKGALHSFVKAVNSEIDRKIYPNILINEYVPGATQTGMSASGEAPSASFPRVKRLVELPSGGPTGRLFFRDKELYVNETPKAMLKRVVMRSLGRR